MTIITDLQEAGCEVESGPWRRGWASISREMQIGSLVEMPNEREMRSFIQTMRTCGFRSSVRKNKDGSYTVKKVGIKPKMIWTREWKDGVRIRRQIPDPSLEKVPVGVTVTLSAEAYERLQKYCDNEAVGRGDAIARIVDLVLRRYERYALVE